MKIKLKSYVLLPSLIAAALTPASAATTFITNNTTPKVLASDESDAFVGVTTNGGTDIATNGLDGDGAGDTTALLLSVDDGGGTINVTTSSVLIGTSETNLVMDGDSMGVGNDKWGDTEQAWTWSFNQTVDFLGFSFNENKNTQFTFSSVAWKDDTDATGTNWSFTSDGTTGVFVMTMENAPTVFDLSSAGVSNVSAGTDLNIFKSGGGSGSGMTSFSIDVIPEPSVALLGGIGMLLLLRRQR